MVGQGDKSLCCGCGTCTLVCPRGCITMVEDEAGFIMPRVNEQACIRCGKCTSVCPVLNYERQTDLEHRAYAAHAKEASVRFEGSSGGMFGLLAREVLSRGGVVYGAAFDERLQLRCTCARTEQELAPLYKSKYLQCTLGDAFEHIRAELATGRPVLYTATPCYVYALKRYLGHEYDGLYTVDFSCHGVPSQSLFDRCRQLVEQRRGVDITGYEFRSKKPNGATPHYYRMCYVNKGRQYTSRPGLYTKSPFYLGFQKYITLRDSCYDCRFGASNRCSELTIGDFHNVDQHIKGVDRFAGVSLVTINNLKGARLWDAIAPKTVHWPMDFAGLLEAKELMCGGTQKPAGRERFVADLTRLPFEQVVDRHMNCKKEWKKSVYYALPRPVRELIKNVMGIK